MANARSKQVDCQDCCQGYETKKVAVVASANTIVQPDAVMVLRINAVVANPAMVASGRPPDVTGLTVFGGDLEGPVRLIMRGDYDPLGQGWTRGEWIRIWLWRWKGVDVARIDLSTS